jgi:hypothetical protein
MEACMPDITALNLLQALLPKQHKYGLLKMVSGMSKAFKEAAVQIHS